MPSIDTPLAIYNLRNENNPLVDVYIHTYISPFGTSTNAQPRNISSLAPIHLEGEQRTLNAQRVNNNINPEVVPTNSTLRTGLLEGNTNNLIVNNDSDIQIVDEDIQSTNNLLGRKRTNKKSENKNSSNKRQRENSEREEESNRTNNNIIPEPESRVDNSNNPEFEMMIEEFFEEEDSNGNYHFSNNTESE